MFDIIIPAYNALSFSKECVKSIFQTTHPNMFRIIFVDDCSTDETHNWSDTIASLYDTFFVIHNDKNVGYVQSVLNGTEFSIDDDNSFPYIFVLNNDIVINDRWVDGALELFESDEKLAVIGAFGTKEVAGKKIDFISGSRLIVKKSVIERIGFYDPNFKFGYWEDVEFSYRVQKNGFKIKKYSFFEKHSTHVKNVSFKHNSNRKTYYEDNRKYLENKINWGYYEY